MSSGSESRFFITGKLSRKTGWVVEKDLMKIILDVEVLIRREMESVSKEPRINSSLRDRRRERVPSAKLNRMENRNINNKTNHSLTCSMGNVGHEAHKRAKSSLGQGVTLYSRTTLRITVQAWNCSADVSVAPVDRADG